MFFNNNGIERSDQFVTVAGTYLDSGTNSIELLACIGHADVSFLVRLSRQKVVLLSRNLVLPEFLLALHRQTRKLRSSLSCFQLTAQIRDLLARNHSKYLTFLH